MRELAALVGRHVRSAVRGRGVLYVLGGGLLAIGAVLLLVPTGEGVRSTVILGGLSVVGVIAFGTAAWAGGLLPGDRVAGRDLWLATTAPPSPLRRVSAAAAGLLLAPAAALLGAALLGVLLPALLDDTTVRAAEEIPVAVARVPNPPAHSSTLRLDLPGVRGGEPTLEVDLRVLYLDESKAGSRLELAYAFEGPRKAAGRSLVPGFESVRIPVPPGATAVRLARVQDHAVLVLRGGRVLGEARSFFATLLLAGLVLGIAAGAMAPIAVGVSRWTSAPTATTAAFVLAAVGAFRFLLADLAVPEAGWFHEAGLTVVGAATRLAPDLGSLGALAEPAAGRALGVADLAGAWPLVLYGAAGLVVVLVPVPNEPALGRTS